MKYLFTMSIEMSYLAIDPQYMLEPWLLSWDKTLQLYSLFYQTVSACTPCPKIIKVYKAFITKIEKLNDYQRLLAKKTSFFSCFISSAPSSELRNTFSVSKNFARSALAACLMNPLLSKIDIATGYSSYERHS